jgi:hypothetical protein
MLHDAVLKNFRVGRLLGIACAVLLIGTLRRTAVWAEDQGFAVVDTKIAKPEPAARESKVFSFGRFEPALREICREMELDGRRTKLVQLSEVGRKGHADCASCRALWKSIYWACRDSAVMDNTASKQTKKKQVQAKPDDEAEGVGEAAPQPTATATPKPLQRYPTTTMLDLTSRLSVSLYNQDPGTGGFYKALQSFTNTLTGDPTLTLGERDYYTVFASFLMASWVDRDVPAAQEAPQTKQDLSGIFE